MEDDLQCVMCPLRYTCNILYRRLLNVIMLMKQIPQKKSEEGENGKKQEITAITKRCESQSETNYYENEFN